MVTFNLDDSVGYLVRRTSLRFQAHLPRIFKEKGYDLTTEQWAALCRLWEEDGLSQREIGNRLPQGLPNISRILDRLEKKKLIIRLRDTDDRRVIRIYLAKRGRDIKDTLIPIGIKGLEIAYKGLSQEEVETLRKLLNKVFENLDNHVYPNSDSGKKSF